MRSAVTMLPLAALSAIASASAWSGLLPSSDSLASQQDNALILDDLLNGLPPARRQNDNEDDNGNGDNNNNDDDNTTSESVTSTFVPATETETGTGTETGRQTTTGERTGTRTEEPTETGTQTNAESTSIPFDAQPGGINMITPGIIAAASTLYKVGDYVTFSWNYTNLLAEPTGVDVIVSCSAPGQALTWTLTANMTFETEASYIWDTTDDQDQDYIPEMYTVIIKNSDSEITDVAGPGVLAAHTGATFGVYTGAPYVDYDEWECVGCNAAPPSTDRQALGFALIMSVITVGTFTWFTLGFGLQ